MNQVFKPFLRRFVLVFFYDILVYNPDLDTHRRHLGVVFNVLSDNNLFANRKKCTFAQTRVSYIGHWVLEKGVEADNEKIRAMLQWPIPKNIRELRGFLGMTGYYRRFVLNYSNIATPLTQLTKKDAFKWIEEATLAFEHLKHAMVTLPDLALLDFSLPFVIETNASSTGLGVVLSQKQHSIAFFSQYYRTKGKPN